MNSNPLTEYKITHFTKKNNLTRIRVILQLIIKPSYTNPLYQIITL